MLKKKQGQFPDYGLSHRDLKTIRWAMDEMEELSRRAKVIPENVHGSHYMGNMEIIAIYERLKSILDAKLSDEKPFRDYLYNNAPRLYLNGHRIVQSGFPVPEAMLISGYRCRGEAFVVQEIVFGSKKAWDQHLPISKRVRTDNTRNLYVDLADMEETLKGWMDNTEIWSPWFLHDALDLCARILLDKPYHLEKSGLFELAIFAGYFKMDQSISAIQLILFSDFLLNSGVYRNRWRSMDKQLKDLAIRFAWSGEIPESLLPKREITREAHKEVHSQLTENIIKPLRTIYEKRISTGGVSTPRRMGSLVLAGRKKCKPFSLPEEAPEIENISKILTEKITGILLNDHFGTSGFRKTVHLPVDVADLESGSQARKWMAACDVQGEYSGYMENPEFVKIYERTFRETPDCPMPLAGPPTWSIEGRFMAAMFSQLISELGPDVRFAGPLNLFIGNSPMESSNHSEAMEKMMQKIKTIFDHWLAVQGLLETGLTENLLEAWVSYYEYVILYMGCGVSSLTDMLWILFFASEPVFESCLEYETSELREQWRHIRTTLELLKSMIMSKDFDAVLRAFNTIGDELEKMALHLVEHDDPGGSGVVDNPTSFENQDPFAAPPNYFSKKMLQAKYSRSPIEMVEIPPGNSSRYSRLAARNDKHIKMLKRIQGEPLEEAANLVGYMQNGPFFDSNQFDRLLVGHCIFSSVSFHPPQPCPHKRIQVVFLLDMSGSMDQDRVNTAKNIGIIMAEGLMGRFEIDFYMYNTAGLFYRLTMLMKSSNRRLTGKSALASITRQGFETGDGWNPDAAILSCITEMYGKSASGPVIICLIGDHEYCTSLVDDIGCESAEEEMELVLGEMLEDNRFHFVACRVGRDEDPFEQMPNLRRHYIHIPDEPVSKTTMQTLYHILETCSLPFG